MVALVEAAATVNQSLAVLHPRSDVVSGEYLWLYLDAHYGELRGLAGELRDGLNLELIKSFVVALPPAEEQAAIVKYLGHAHARIDRAIAAKRKLIALLEEQKRALVDGLLAKLGARSEQRRLKTMLIGVDQGISPQAENLVPGEGEWGVLKAGCVNRGRFRPDQVKRLPDGFPVPVELAIDNGDLLVSRASGSPDLVGSAARVTGWQGHAILSDKTFRLRLRPGVDPDYVALALNSGAYREQVRLAISGADGLASNLPLPKLRSFTLPLPELDIQKGVVAEVGRASDTIERTVARTESEIELLREFRTRLTADVVTGQVDVRAIAATLPDLPVEQGFDVGDDDQDESYDEELLDAASEDE